MEIARIQPNCSEVALVVYSDKLSERQKKFVDEFIANNSLIKTTTPLGNISIEAEVGGLELSKSDLWRLKEKLQDISNWEKMCLEDGDHFDLIRDDSYFDLIEEKAI